MGLTALNLNGASPLAPPEQKDLRTVLRDAAKVARDREEENALRAKEAIAPQLFGLLAGDSEDAKFRRITSPATMRDLNPLMQLRMQQVCFYLAVTTPFGRRILRMMTDYIVGEGFSAKAEDPAVQAVIDRFWKDPINNMDENIEQLTHELLMLGEICLPVAVNPVDGFTRISYVDAQEIEAVEFALIQTAASQEVTVPMAVRLLKRIGETAGRRLQIIHLDEDVNSPNWGQLAGDCFYFPINKAKSASRGISEIFALADWIDVFDQMIFDFADRVRFLNSFIWHYVIQGGTDAEVKKMQDFITKRPPRQGGVMVTNERLTIEARTPDLRGSDMNDAGHLVKIYGLGGAGFPSWFFADSEGSNRAVAQEMQGPVGKMLTSRQNVIKRVVTQIIDFAIAQAVQHGVLVKGKNDLSWKLVVPDLSVDDMAGAAQALVNLVNACGQAEDRGWVRGETASSAFTTLLTQVGVSVDPDEFQQAQAQKTARDAKNQDALNPQQNLADALKKTLDQSSGNLALGETAPTNADPDGEMAAVS